jgi:hypothetical protein
MVCTVETVESPGSIPDSLPKLGEQFDILGILTIPFGRYVSAHAEKVPDGLSGVVERMEENLEGRLR